MAITSKRLCAGTLTDSNATLYTAPSSSGNYTIVKSLTLCNKTAVDATVTIKLNGIEIISTYIIYAYDTLTISNLDHIIAASELIEGLASAATTINYYISGKEVT